MSSQTASALISAAPTPVMSISPVVLPAPGRVVDLQLRISAPVTGRDLPIILLSHGHGGSNHLSSLNGYAPLANFYAADGFVVIQPTHLSSKTLAGIVDAKSPEAPLFWRSRAEDMKRILDGLDQLEAVVPMLQGRLDRSRIAAVGHSLGGHTVSLLAGMRVIGPASGQEVNLYEPRIKAAVLLGAPGGSEGITPKLAQLYPFFQGTDFAEMKTPTLVVAGDKDKNPNFSARDDWRSEAYSLSPGPKSLLTIFDGEHMLGGLSGYDAGETTDEDPARVALVQQLTAAYLRTALYPADTSWPEASKVLRETANPPARIESK